jgi:hypothetical protein
VTHFYLFAISSIFTGSGHRSGPTLSFTDIQVTPRRQEEGKGGRRGEEGGGEEGGGGVETGDEG